MAKPFVPNQYGLFKPDSDWQAPKALPDLRGRPLVALDLENKDDGITSNRGPGWALGPLGYMCGVAWAADDSVGYASVRHPDTENFDHGTVMRWVDELFRSGTRVVFHNAQYDLGWLWAQGAAPPDGRTALDDTLTMAVMLDETHRYPETYGLDDCCRRAGVPGKDTELLKQAVQAYGGDPRNPAGDLWRLPARYAGPYAEADVRATLALARQLAPALDAQGLRDAYQTEMELIPMTTAMRRRGVRLDTDRALQTAVDFRGRRDAALKELSHQFSTQRREVTVEDIRSPKWLEMAHRQENIHFPRAEKVDRGSFQKDWMEKHPHWLPQMITKALKYENAASKFVDTFLLGFSHRGRIHAQVNQFLGENGGTRSHRFSYSEPPLQQMPSDDDVGAAVRGCFLPEQGEYWAANDYASQEPRLTVHYAARTNCTGADLAVKRYQEDPSMSYHDFVAGITGLPRKRAKIINLAVTYGKGTASLAEEMGLSIEETKAILDTYHTEMPYAKQLEEKCKNIASSRGYVRLIDGARMRYTQWEGGWVDGDLRRAAIADGKRLEPCSREDAEARARDLSHPWNRTRLRRADTRKALNNVIQGSAARQTKIAMRNMWREGILPLIQMHDEVDVSVGSEAEVQRVAQLMIEATPLLVPVVVDMEVGPSWGEAKQSWADCLAKYGPPGGR